jgi:hydrogenase nickel incorporation protein HypA/HybF
MSAVQAAEEHARKHGASEIKRLHLRIGKLVAVVPETLEFVWDMVRQDTMAAEAELTWEEAPVECRCPKCEIAFSADGAVYRCPKCDEPSSEITSGRQLEIVSIEVE